MNTEQNKDWAEDLTKVLLWIGSQWAMAPINSGSSLALKLRSTECLRAAFEKQTAELRDELRARNKITITALDWAKQNLALKQRAESAEARVKELDERATLLTEQVCADDELREQLLASEKRLKFNELTVKLKSKSLKQRDNEIVNLREQLAKCGDLRFELAQAKKDSKHWTEELKDYYWLLENATKKNIDLQELDCPSAIHDARIAARAKETT